ncbi:uncharacterized protein LOC126880570 [Diabrotica virgifera virgifera]|uniref:Uncharacterized protein n=1 Tax=Diabrotica virgifera virgifera TaxID=50390 RepID=A0ABM5JRB4_DIAVI|nr:uncharacterized protein LOC126880570 [Diabrotica virgifera virgifera]
MEQYYQGYENDEILDCHCSPYAECQQQQEEQYDDDLNCDCSPEAPCQESEENGEEYAEEDEFVCACSPNAICKKSPHERQLLELTDIGVLRPDMKTVDTDPLLEEPYSTVDLTNSQVLMTDVPNEEEVSGLDSNGGVVFYEPDDLFLYVAPQSHNLLIQRQRLLDSYIEDLSISEVEEAAVALRLLVNLFRQRRMDMNKLVPLFRIAKSDQMQTRDCGCPL